MPTRVFFQHEYIFCKSIHSQHHNYNIFYDGEKYLVHITVLKGSNLGKHILFQQKSKLVPFHFINNSKTI